MGSYFAYTHKAVSETLAKAGLQPGDINWVVSQNTTERAWHVLCRMLGIDVSRVWAPSMADAGHVISADNIINLAELQKSGRLRPGDRVLLAMAGFGMNWQCAVLEATAEAAR